MLRSEVETRATRVLPAARIEPDPRARRGDFSFRARAENLERLFREEFDLAIIGGGVTGAGIARDAAIRGMKVALVEKDDYASGSSSKSSKMVHGGLRYLKRLEIGLVREALRERAVLLRIAPHLVRPTPHLIPAYGHARKLALRAGMLAYRALAASKHLAPFEELSREEVLRLEPLLKREGLRGGCVYYDCLVDDARLTLATLKSAFEYGAAVANYAECVGLEQASGVVTGVRVRDRVSGWVGRVRARVVANAAGVWADSMRSAAERGRKLLRPTKGIHVVVSAETLNVRHVVAHPISDGRAIFVVPRGEFTYIGTTDTDYEQAPENARAEIEDVSYLLRAVEEIFDGVHLSPEDVLSTWAGLRPLAEGRGEPSSLSRDYRFEVATNGLVTVVGGKLTTHRSMAEAVVDQIATRLQKRFGECRTTRLPLAGGGISDFPTYADGVVRAAAGRWGLHGKGIERLVSNYGTDFLKVLALGIRRPELLDPLASDGAVLKAEAIHAVDEEMAMTLQDFLERRTDLSHFDKRQGLRAAPEAARLMGEALGWDPPEVERQLDRYRQAVESRSLREPQRLSPAGETAVGGR
jgi:glycerol-3-phosphate dehydrogenase